MSFVKQIKELNRKTLAVQSTYEFLGQSAQYKLDTSIQQYSTDLVQAYTALPTSSSQHNFPVYALSSRVAQVLDFARFLKFANLGHINYLLGILDYGITKINDREVFAIILKYLPCEKLLSHNLHLFEGKPEIILQKIIIPILEALVQLHNAGIMHGCINTENIWVDKYSESNSEIEHVVLSNTALEVCGYSQNSFFEPLSRMLAHRAGKSSCLAADCYAVGVLLLVLLANQPHFKIGYEAIVSAKAKLGSYKALLHCLFDDDELKLDQASRYLAYWLLHDDESKRWTASHALKFLRKRHRRITLNNVKKAISEDTKAHNLLPFVFSGEECFSMTEAAVSCIRNYDDIKLKVKNGKLVAEMLNNDAVKPGFISKISILRSFEVSKHSRGVAQEEIFLTLFITLLNNKMPLKIKEITVEPNAIWQLFRYIANKPFTSISKTFQTIICSGLLQAICKTISDVCAVKIDLEDFPDCKIVRALNFADVSIADFIHSYTCLAGAYMLHGKICFNNDDITSLMVTLDESIVENIISDEKLLCFMLGRIAKKSEIRIVKNSLFDPENDDLSRALFILGLCHEMENKKPLRNLASYFFKKLSSDYLVRIKHLKLRSRIIAQLKTAADAGDISLMSKILTSPEIDKKEKQHMKALKKVDGLRSAIKDCNRKRRDVENIHYIARQNTIRIAGLVFLTTLGFIIYNLFLL